MNVGTIPTVWYSVLFYHTQKSEYSLIKVFFFFFTVLEYRNEGINIIKDKQSVMHIILIVSEIILHLHKKIKQSQNIVTIVTCSQNNL